MMTFANSLLIIDLLVMKPENSFRSVRKIWE